VEQALFSLVCVVRVSSMHRNMTRVERFSYFFIFLVIVLAGALHLAPPLVTVLFSYFALHKLNISKNRWLTVILFLVLIGTISYGVFTLVKQAIEALPKIGSESIPSIVAYAQSHNIDLPFIDYESFKALIMDTAKDEFKVVGNFARAATKQFVFLVIGAVVALGLFLNPTVDTDAKKRPSLFTSIVEQITNRFACFYESFERVMGAQLVISTVNTVLTAIFVLVIHLKHAGVVIGLTFLCGLLPIIGNLISNTIIVCIAFTISPRAAIAALVFLIALHKLEYFLNSKIIGERIKNPVWLTLLALILGERLMGIPGMILAPVILHYIKVETSKLPPSTVPAPISTV
jgi:predicted PurR-regulated permease PerM